MPCNLSSGRIPSGNGYEYRDGMLRGLSVLLYDLNFQVIKIDLFDKAVLTETGSGMPLKIMDSGIQPDRLFQIKLNAGLIQRPEDLMGPGILPVVTDNGIPDQMIVPPYFSP